MEQSAIENLNKALMDLLREHKIQVHRMVEEERGKRVFLNSSSGKIHECVVRTLNLDIARSIKILKSDFDSEIKENRWIILVLVMEQMHPSFYMIPLTVFRTPNNWFVDNEQPPRLSHLSNWEIKIYRRAIPQISRFLLESTLDDIK